MATTRTRRIVPLLITATLAAAGAGLTTTAYAAPTATGVTTTGVTPAGVTTDTDTPGGNSILSGLGKLGNLSKIGNNTAAGGYTEPPTVDTDEGPVDGRGGSGGDPNSRPTTILNSQTPLGQFFENRILHAQSGPILTDEP
ncbi:hypothetical protein [Streptomyces bambusae]|uniref:ATP-binding protein n=1 Tax=Streptomyces bambusae TaxID=1550616 RepID=A0ABS6ZB37_9ACTN|nr:hypothetical protein [Streptomyces bambusae]MBW5484644.1 hypothetical protein [Streptomyces bambusae]